MSNKKIFELYLHGEKANLDTQEINIFHTTEEPYISLPLNYKVLENKIRDLEEELKILKDWQTFLKSIGIYQVGEGD